MTLDYEMLKGFDRTLTDALYKCLYVTGVEAHPQALAFLEEDPSTVHRRNSLYKHLERLQGTLFDLQNILAATSDTEGDEAVSNTCIEAGIEFISEYEQ